VSFGNQTEMKILEIGHAKGASRNNEITEHLTGGQGPITPSTKTIDWAEFQETDRKVENCGVQMKR